MITRRQGTILTAIVESIEKRGFPPSVREIGERVALSSSSTVQCHLRTLEKRGLIERDPTKPRALALTAAGRDTAAGLLGRPLDGLLESKEGTDPYDAPSEAATRTRATIDGILTTQGVIDRATVRVRDKHSWLNEDGAAEIVGTVFGAIRECLG